MAAATGVVRLVMICVMPAGYIYRSEFPPMISIPLALALMVPVQSSIGIDGQTVFGLLEAYHAAFRDVSFLCEGEVTQTARTAGKDPPGTVSRFQGLYVYRNDGATLLDMFSFDAGAKPDRRVIRTLLHGQLQILDVSPDVLSTARAPAPNDARCARLDECTDEPGADFPRLLLPHPGAIRPSTRLKFRVGTQLPATAV